MRHIERRVLSVSRWKERSFGCSTISDNHITFSTWGSVAASSMLEVQWGTGIGTENGADGRLEKNADGRDVASDNVDMEAVGETIGVAGAGIEEATNPSCNWRQHDHIRTVNFIAGRRGGGGGWVEAAETIFAGTRREDKGWHPSTGVNMKSPSCSCLVVVMRVGNSLQDVSTVSMIGASHSVYENVISPLLVSSIHDTLQKKVHNIAHNLQTQHKLYSHVAFLDRIIFGQ